MNKSPLAHERAALIAHLAEHVSAARWAKMQECIALRTRYTTLVLENIQQPQNTNAALRSCEILGVQDLHIVEDTHSFSANAGISRGASDWLSLKRYNKQGGHPIAECYAYLRARGYRILATTPRGGSTYAVQDVPLDQPCAFVFGAEEVGLSSYALEHADATVTIPMYGFTQSFNISVSVALAMYETVRRLHASSHAWQLTSEEQEHVLLAWLRRDAAGATELERRFLQRLREGA